MSDKKIDMPKPVGLMRLLKRHYKILDESDKAMLLSTGKNDKKIMDYLEKKGI